MHAHAALNRVYRLVWSALHQTWVVASELTRGQGKSNATPLLSAVLLVSLAGLSGGAGAAPQGGQVVSGSGSISASGSPGQSTTTITQASDKLSINWQSFNVGTSETVNFLQPSASALAVNRIFDTQGSQILGRVNANGQVWLINPNGVLFGRDAQINVGGLVASTLNPDDASIGSARSNFSGSSTAGVVNLGSIHAAQGGYVALLGHSVSNSGQISAPSGTVALSAGSAVSLNFAGSKLLGLEVTSNQVNALAENGGLIQADGGQVLLSAGARESLLASVVNNTGVIQAHTVQEQDGKIILLGGMAAGTANVKGTLDASAPSGGNGGFIETSAYSVKVDDSASITTASAQGKRGQWLIDPYDFYVASSGGNITGAALGTALDSNDVTIQTTDSGTTATGAAATAGNSGNGNIYVNDTVSWSANYTLTLNAYNSIYINSAITARGASGKLALLYGQASTSGGSANYFVNAPVSLQAGANFSTKLGTSTNAPYALKNYTVITSLGNAGDQSVASATNSLQGLGHSSRLSGNYVLGADINASSTSNWNSTGFVYEGFSPIGDDNKQFTGTFDGLGHTITGLTINRTQAGHVGLFGYAGQGSVVKNIGLSEVSFIGGDYTSGGLVGTNWGTISSSYATGSVSGNNYVGGLVGENYGAVSNSYAVGAVKGDSFVGGLVGNNSGIGSISNSYATVRVDSDFDVGGLVGGNFGIINNSYATGSVSGTYNVGGLVGGNSGTIKNSYFDKGTTRQEYGVGSDSSASGVTGLSTANAFTQSNYSGMDFTNTWYMVDGATRPFLRSEWSTTVRNTHQLQLMAMKLDSSYTLANSLDLTADLANTSSMWKTSGGFSSNYGFSPIGNATNKFTGRFDGKGHTISGLTINRSSADYVGLFGYVGTGGVVQNVGLVNASVIGKDSVGGLVGLNEGSVGNSYATGNVNGFLYVGGLVGENSGGAVSNSYATVAVTGHSFVGGLVGWNLGTISNSYATGSVNAEYYAGGLVGYNDENEGRITDSYFDADTTRRADGMGSGSSEIDVKGLSSTEMKQSSNFSGFNFTNTWFSYDGYTNPLLRAFLTPLSVTYTVSGSKTYDGTNACVTNTMTCSNTTGTLTSGKSILGTVVLSSKNAGTVTATGLYSDQQGYLITASTSGTATIDKANLTQVTASKTYDGLSTVTATQITAIKGVSGESFTTSAGTAAISDKNVATTNKTITDLSGLTLTGVNGGLISNYNLTSGLPAAGTNNAVTITAKTASVSGTRTSTTYSGATQTQTGATTSGFITGDNVTVSGLASGKNANTYTSTLAVGGTDATNYNVTITNADLAIAKADATVTANSNTALSYNGAHQTVTGFTASGLQGGESASVLSGVAASTTYKNAGTYRTTASGTDANYNLSFVDGSMAIAKAILTYTANKVSTNAGNTPTGLSGTVSGFMRDEMQSTATTGTLAWITPATSASSAGSYAINGSGLSAVNYSFIQAVENATALTLTQSVSIVPVINPPSLSSDTSFTKSAQFAQTTAPLSGADNINTLPATSAGSVQSNGPTLTKALGSSGLLYAQGSGVNLPADFLNVTPADPAQNP